MKFSPHRLAVRSRPFQGRSTGSNPVGGISKPKEGEDDGGRSAFQRCGAGEREADTPKLNFQNKKWSAAGDREETSCPSLLTDDEISARLKAERHEQRNIECALALLGASDRKEIAMRVFRVYNGQAIIGHLGVPATSRDVLAEAERKADEDFGLWDRLEEVEYVD